MLARLVSFILYPYPARANGETVLRLLPPLTISRAEADSALERIAAALEEFAKTI